MPINRIVRKHLPIIAADFIWILYFDNAALWIGIDNLLVFGGRLFFLAHRTASHHHLHALIFHLVWHGKNKRENTQLKINSNNGQLHHSVLCY